MNSVTKSHQQLSKLPLNTLTIISGIPASEALTDDMSRTQQDGTASKKLKSYQNAEMSQTETQFSAPHIKQAARTPA